MRRGTPDQFIKELTEKIHELKEVESSSAIIDDGEDIIQADEYLDTEEKVDETEITEESSDEEVKTITVDSAPVDQVEVSNVEEDSSEYLTGLYRSVEKELNDLIQSVAWSTDEDNIYMDVNFADGHIFTFTIPKADLSYDIQTQDKDIQYICVAVRDSQEPSEVVEDEAYNMEDYYSEEDRPAYL